MSSSAQRIWIQLVAHGLLITTLAFADETADAQGIGVTFVADGQEVDVGAALRSVQRPIPNVVDPHTDKHVPYKGYELGRLLEAAFGKDRLTRTDQILFHCRDGYAALLDADKARSQHAFLATERTDRKRFTLGNGEKQIELGPAYLVWNDGRGFDYPWPYQVSKIELIDSETYARMLPPQGATDDAKRGFATFKHACANCHSINGLGGNKGGELNYPVSVAEYFKPKWLRQWIENPASMKYGVLMPSFPEYEHKQKRLDEVVSYLEAMRLKQPPAEQTEDP